MADPISASLFAVGVSKSAALTIGSVAATVSTIASVGSSVFGVVNSLAAGGMRLAGIQQQNEAARAQAGALNRQAQLTAMQGSQAALQAQGELLKGQQQSLQVRQALLRTLAAQNARYAGAGLALDDGTPATIADETQRQAEIELGLISTNTRMAYADRRLQQSGFMTQAYDLYDRAGTTIDTARRNANLTLFDVADRTWQRLPGFSTGGARTPSDPFAARDATGI